MSFAKPLPMQRFERDMPDGALAIAYFDAAPPADGPAQTTPVLLIHGFASNAHVNWVYTGWVKALNAAGYRVIGLDNRGHGRSSKLYDSKHYPAAVMAQDAYALLQHLGIKQAHVMGYSMGARISAFLSLSQPDAVRCVVFGGLGINLVQGMRDSTHIIKALMAEDASNITDPVAREFRQFAEATKSDLKALAACMASSRQRISPDAIAGLKPPALVAVGTHDHVAGSGSELAALIPSAQHLEISGRDHQRAVGDTTYKQGVLQFFAAFQ